MAYISSVKQKHELRKKQGNIPSSSSAGPYMDSKCGCTCEPCTGAERFCSSVHWPAHALYVHHMFAAEATTGHAGSTPFHFPLIATWLESEPLSIRTLSFVREWFLVCLLRVDICIQLFIVLSSCTQWWINTQVHGAQAQGPQPIWGPLEKSCVYF